MPPSLIRFRAVVLVAGLFVAVSAATRLILGLRADVALPGGMADWARILSRGLLFDVAAALCVAAPMVLWLALVPDRMARWRLHRGLALATTAAYAYGFLLLALSEWFFWDEFGSRFNFIAVDYLLYTHEVLGNIWQSYPVGTLLAGLLVPAGLAAMLLARPVWRSVGEPLPWRSRLAVLALWVLAVGLTLRFVNSDQRNFSPADAANDLAGNGLYEFFAANYRNELDYDRHYATLDRQEALGFVRTELGAEGDGVERLVKGAGTERRLNVVLISVESLGAEYLGVYGHPGGLTPNLDRLARESLWFSNVYATGNRTVRGLEALSLALPPTPGQSIVRRPKNETLFSLGSVFEDKGYQVLFVYGGYGYFDNMAAFFDANDYRSVDRRSIPSSRIEMENIWGVADEHLFDQALEEMDREQAKFPQRPVFMHVMTTSNHRPYTYPAGRIDIPSGTGRDGAVKYSDYAVGRFIEMAGNRPWFRDTLFVITADHGANARGTSRIPLPNYVIPLMVYAPAHVAPGKVERLMSQIDIAPTVLGLLDFTYYSKFFGRDVLRASPETDRAFVGNYQTLGYIRGDRIVVLQPKRKVEVLRLGKGGEVLKAEHDDVLAREAIAYYQSASQVFREGLFGDEEQVPPEQRIALRASSHRAD